MFNIYIYLFGLALVGSSLLVSCSLVLAQLRCHLLVQVLDSGVKLCLQHDDFLLCRRGIPDPFFHPRMILRQKNLNYTSHCQYAMGTYVQAHEEPKHSNTNAALSLDCIYLRYKDNLQGGHELLHLPTNSIITWRNITPVPITPAIVKQVHMLAQDENMPVGLKIVKKTGQVFYDSAWIPGVDYDDKQFDNKEYKDGPDQGDDPTISLLKVSTTTMITATICLIMRTMLFR